MVKGPSDCWNGFLFIQLDYNYYELRIWIALDSKWKNVLHNMQGPSCNPKLQLYQATLWLLPRLNSCKLRKDVVSLTSNWLLLYVFSRGFWITFSPFNPHYCCRPHYECLSDTDVPLNTNCKMGLHEQISIQMFSCV